MRKCLILMAIIGLIGCGNDNGNVNVSNNGNATTTAPTANLTNHSDTAQTAESITAPPTATANQTDDSEPEIKPIKNADGKWQIDWTLVDTGVTPIDPATANYPFALDSDPVKKYADEYKITPAQAQHSMMIAMASPEALGKLLDQLNGLYVAHELTDGAEMKLIVKVKPTMAGETHDYVFADDFAKGLVLPVVIEPVK